MTLREDPWHLEEAAEADRLRDAIRAALRCETGRAAFRELAALLPHAALVEALGCEAERNDAPRWLIGRDRGPGRMKTRPDSA